MKFGSGWQGLRSIDSVDSEKLHTEVGIAKAHDPLIEGLRHGWAQQQGRPKTAFGSGWRGLVSVPSGLTQLNVKAIMESSASRETVTMAHNSLHAARGARQMLKAL